MEAWWGDAVHIVKLFAVILFGLVTLALFGRICEYMYQMKIAKKKERLSLFILAYLILNLLFNANEFALAFLDDPSTDPNILFPLRILSSSLLGPPSLLSTIIHILLCSPFVSIQYVNPSRGAYYARVMVAVCIVVHIILLAPNYISFLTINSNLYVYYRMGGLVTWILYTVAVDMSYSILASKNLIRVKLLGLNWNMNKEKDSNSDSPKSPIKSPLKSPLFLAAFRKTREGSGSDGITSPLSPGFRPSIFSTRPFGSLPRNPEMSKVMQSNRSAPILPVSVQNAFKTNPPNDFASSDRIASTDSQPNSSGTLLGASSSNPLVNKTGSHLSQEGHINDKSQLSATAHFKQSQEMGSQNINTGLSSTEQIGSKPVSQSFGLEDNHSQSQLQLTSFSGVGTNSTPHMRKALSKASLSLQVDTRPTTLKPTIPSKNTPNSASTLALLFSPTSAKSTTKMRDILSPTQVEAFTKSEKATMRFAIVLASFDIMGLIMFAAYVYFRMLDQLPLYQCFRMLFYVFMTAHHIVISYFWVLLRQLYGILSKSVKEYQDLKRKTTEAKRKRRPDEHDLTKQQKDRRHKQGNKKEMIVKSSKWQTMNPYVGAQGKKSAVPIKRPRREEAIASLTPSQANQQLEVEQKKKMDDSKKKEFRKEDFLSTVPSTTDDVSESYLSGTTTELSNVRPPDHNQQHILSTEIQDRSVLSGAGTTKPRVAGQMRAPGVHRGAQQHVLSQNSLLSNLYGSQTDPL